MANIARNPTSASAQALGAMQSTSSMANRRAVAPKTKRAINLMAPHPANKPAKHTPSPASPAFLDAP
ncbi:MAG: hypothetical protein COB34_08340 [Methylophilaceae bacterium]|nr:MAG: hypothetical protein COB34_08340 [Methylophilaceae bacterium]